MIKNIIILTSGISGSSVLTGLLSKAGYWKGDNTCIKPDYNTHENEQLVILNKQLLAKVRYKGLYTNCIDYIAIEKLKSLHNLINLNEYEDFIKSCNESSPWIWKDPRLFITIPFWKKLLDKNSVEIQYIYLDRDIFQRWISLLLRRNVQSYPFCKKYTNSVKSLADNFFLDNKLTPLPIKYDDLILHPEDTIMDINNCLGTKLSLIDLKSIFHGELYKKSKGTKDLLLACLIYIKNYHIANRI